MIIQKLKDANISKVYIAEDGYPHCKIHGAMNKLTSSGIWRCVSSYRMDGDKLIENVCNAGFQEG
jgi:hypothetical protein